MNSKVERCDVIERDTGDKVGWSEAATITFEGREFTSGGAHVDPEHAIGYPEFDYEFVGASGVLKAWDGSVMGPCRIIGARPAVFFGHRSHYGSTYYYIRATIEGRTYSGAGFGSGMFWRGRAVKSGPID